MTSLTITFALLNILNDRTTSLGLEKTDGDVKYVCVCMPHLQAMEQAGEHTLVTRGQIQVVALVGCLGRLLCKK